MTKLHQGIEPDIYIKIREQREPEYHEYKVYFERTSGNETTQGTCTITETTPYKAMKEFYFHHLNKQGIFKAMKVTNENNKVVWQRKETPNYKLSNI